MNSNGYKCVKSPSSKGLVHFVKVWLLQSCWCDVLHTVLHSLYGHKLQCCTIRAYCDSSLKCLVSMIVYEDDLHVYNFAMP